MVGAAADPVPVALLVAGVFERLGVPYLIGGSLASTLYGEPRATLDVDFAAHLGEEHVEDLLALLEHDFFVDAYSVREAVAWQAHFNAVHRKALLKVDVYVRPRSGHFAEEISRAREVRLSAVGSARVATPEDTVLRKLWWCLLGGEVSDRDVLGILRISGSSLDQGYLRHWAPDLGVADLLLRALSDAGLGG